MAENALGLESHKPKIYMQQVGGALSSSRVQKVKAQTWKSRLTTPKRTCHKCIWTFKHGFPSLYSSPPPCWRSPPAEAEVQCPHHLYHLLLFSSLSPNILMKRSNSLWIIWIKAEKWRTLDLRNQFKSYSLGVKAPEVRALTPPTLLYTKVTSTPWIEEDDKKN